MQDRIDRLPSKPGCSRCQGRRSGVSPSTDVAAQTFRHPSDQCGPASCLWSLGHHHVV